MCSQEPCWRAVFWDLSLLQKGSVAPCSCRQCGVGSGDELFLQGLQFSPHGIAVASLGRCHKGFGEQLLPHMRDVTAQTLSSATVLPLSHVGGHEEAEPTASPT